MALTLWDTLPVSLYSAVSFDAIKGQHHQFYVFKHVKVLGSTTAYVESSRVKSLVEAAFNLEKLPPVRSLSG